GNKKLVSELETEGLGDLFSLLDTPAPKEKTPNKQQKYKDEDEDEEDEEEEEEDEDEEDEDENKMEEDEKAAINKWSGNYYSTNKQYGKKVQKVGKEEEEEEEEEEEKQEKDSITTQNTKYIPPSLRNKLESKEEGS